MSEPPFEWQPPSLHVTSTPPRLLSKSTLEPDPELSNNFPRTAKWCGDGSTLMVQCENRSLQLFETCVSLLADLHPFVMADTASQMLRGKLYVSAGTQASVHSSSFVAATCTSLVHSKTLVQPSPIVDFAWYPGASRHNLPSYCFVTSVRDCPVQLVDGKDGRLRASYPIVDHRERQIAPHSLTFNLSAEKLYCGFEDAIEIFDVQTPGEGERLQTTPSKKSKDGLKGIISSIAFSYSPEYYAAGSLTPASHRFDNIALFNESAFEPVLSIGGVSGFEKGGVTQLMFNPIRPHILYASFRRSERLWSWDLRGDASIPLCCFSREETLHEPGRNDLTNQKTRFDVDVTGRWLASGNQRGEIAIYDLSNFGEGEEKSDGQNDVGREIRYSKPTLVYEAHGDAVGSVGFHPLEPILLSVSGSRHFDEKELSDSEDSDSESSDEDAEGSCSDNQGPVVRRIGRRPMPSVRDASIKMWTFNQQS